MTINSIITAIKSRFRMMISAMMPPEIAVAAACINSMRPISVALKAKFPILI